MDESIQTTTSSLLSRARAREERAWEQLVDLYGPLVYSWCLRKGLKREQAEDVGQEVFLAVSRNLASYEHESFRGWLRTITDRKIIDFWEKKTPTAEGGTEGQQRMNGVAAESSSESAEGEHEDNKIMQLSLLEGIRSEFSDQDVLAFCRLIIDEKTPAEVAEELKISRNKVYLAKSRILHRLREMAGKANIP
jgi:RNA polymerase sigma-70 factor (ECF subfamily)